MPRLLPRNERLLGVKRKKPKKNGKLILDLCGGTGAWSKPYEDNGYDVLVVTRPLYDVHTFIPPEKVYGILAAPPCTMFSLARTHAKEDIDLKKGMRTVIRCLEIIWECNYYGNPKFWAMENPYGLLTFFLGKPNYIFDPTEFGENYNKTTALWGYFNYPPKTHHFQAGKYKGNVRPLPPLPPGYKPDPEMREQAMKRAITSSKFADAFYKANP